MSEGLLLVHAFPLDARMWKPQVAALKDRVTTLAPNLPGFGGTSGPEVMTMRDAADRCLQEMDDAGVDRAVVCGLSMGGYVTFELWRLAPERISGLVLANTRSESDTPDAAQNRRNLAARLRAEGSQFLVEEPPALLSETATKQELEDVRAMIADQSPAAIAAAALGMAQRPDSTADLPEIDVPTLVITSTGDRLIPADVSTPMADRIPGAHLKVIDGAGHLSNVEAAPDFDRSLEAHLSRCGL